MDRLNRFGGSSAMALMVSAGAVFWTAASPVALAQEVGVAESDAIIVTATRREQDVQDVSVAVSVLTTQQIEDLAPRNLQDLNGQAPNVFIGMMTASPMGSAIYIRGLGYSEVEKTQNPSIGVIVDGVFLGTNTGQLIDSFDMRQVEVSRGPQGIFFGKNTVGGVISVSRSLPTREWGFRGSAAIGSDNEQVYRAIFNMPIGDSAGLKIGGTYRDRDGYLDNVFTGNSDAEREYAGATVAFDWDITSSLNMLASYDIIRAEGGGSPVQFGNAFAAPIWAAISGGTIASLYPNYNAETGSPWGLRPREIANGTRDADEYEVDLYSLTFTLDTAIGTLVAQSAYYDSFDEVLQDFDGTCRGSPDCAVQFPLVGYPINPALSGTGGVLATLRTQEYTQLTQEVRLNGTVGSLDYLLGAYYYAAETDLRQVTNGVVLQESGEENDSLSFFGNLDWHLTDRLTLSGGVRHIEESKDFYTEYGLVSSPGAIVPLINDSEEWSDTITRFAVSWQATDQTLFYLSRAEGFRSGGFSLRGTLSERSATQPNCGVVGGCPNNNFLTYEPETVTAWELGIKNSWLDNNLIFNTAIFQSIVEGFQTSQVVVTTGYGPGTNTYINNYPEVEIQGVEFELVMRPVFISSALEGLTLSATLGLQEAEITDGVVDGRRVGLAGGVVDFAGRRLTRVPDYNTAFRATYDRDVGPGTLRLAAGYTYQDDFGLGVFAGQTDVEPGYSLVDASIGYEWSNYRLVLSGKNLGETDYRVQSLPSVFFQGWGDPMTWALELSAEF